MLILLPLIDYYADCCHSRATAAAAIDYAADAAITACRHTTHSTAFTLLLSPLFSAADYCHYAGAITLLRAYILLIFAAILRHAPCFTLLLCRLLLFARPLRHTLIADAATYIC